MNPGTRLGPYEIVSRIGAGGMGEVWRANDTRLGRSVAVKILPGEFASNAQLRTRFEREARTISLLNHPHICTLFDVGEDYLVMELLEGETLADRLGKGPLPIAEVLRYGTQIADALDKAHRQGVVHRDLKPANVMLTRAGAKLLDFGLAKSAGGLEVNLEGATEHRPLTQEGTILGTFQYMAPEQLEGQSVDHRTDIFALGTLLYEMASGRRAFDGKTKTSLIAAIVTAEPQPLSQLQPLAPPALEHVIRKCLAKDPEERWQSAHDIAEELRWISEAGSQAGVTSAAAASRRVARSTIIVAAVAGWMLAIAAAVVIWSLRARLDQRSRPMHSEIAAPDGVRIGVITQGGSVVSPDGRYFAFPASAGGPPQLFLRDLNNGSTRAIDGTVLGTYPFWSPDGTSLGFFADGKLKIVQMNGGGVQDVASAPAGRGGSWSPNGTIVFAPDINTGLMRVRVGGAPSFVTRVVGEQTSHRNPSVLGDGDHLLYTVRDDSMAAADIHAGSLSKTFDKVVVRKASNAAVYGGYLLYSRGGNLIAQPFDEQQLEVNGSPVVVAENLEYMNPRDTANFTASQNGLLIYRGNASRTAQPTWFAADGRLIGPAAPPGIYRMAAVSPDGRKLLLAKNDGTGMEDLWISDEERGTTARATFLPSGLMFGAMSLDGKRLAVSATYTGSEPMVWTQAVSGSSDRHELYRGRETFLVYSWSPDGRSLYGTTQRNRTGFDIAVMDATSGKYRHLLNAPYDEQTPAVSPDGKWIAYMSNESGRAQIYVTSLPDARMKWQVSVDGGGSPVWSKDGKQLYFGSSSAIFAVMGALFSVRVTQTNDGLHFDAPKKLPFDLENTVARAIAPDGRVVLVQGKPNTTPFHMITNWTRILQK